MLLFFPRALNSYSGTDTVSLFKLMRNGFKYRTGSAFDLPLQTLPLSEALNVVTPTIRGYEIAMFLTITLACHQGSWFSQHP